MNFIVIGLNHKTAPLELREKLAFSKESIPDALDRLKRLQGVNEALILSTCNRVEIYAAAKDLKGIKEEITSFISSYHKIPQAEFTETLYAYYGTEAIHHLMRVASSLDSMIPGEPQILGQVKDSFEIALSQKATGLFLNRLLKKAISAAKRVRNETKIAENAVSISYAAVELAKKIFGSLNGKSVMLLGAGEMAELAAKSLITAGASDIRIANRTYERCCEMAADFGGKAVRFEEIGEEIVEADILICSTNAPAYVLSRDMIASAMKSRRFRPVFVIDISVPRNVDPKSNEIDNVYLYNIDDLQEVIGANINERMKEAAKAEKIVNEEVDKFSRWFASLDSTPIVIAMRRKAEEIKDDELSKFRRKFPDIDPEIFSAAERMADSITKKLIHDPSVAIKDDEDRDILAYAAKKLYGLNENNDE